MNTSRPITKAGQRALALLRDGPLQRNSEAWEGIGGQVVALNTVATLRKRGLVRISADKKWATRARTKDEQA